MIITVRIVKDRNEKGVLLHGKNLCGGHQCSDSGTLWIAVF